MRTKQITSLFLLSAMAFTSCKKSMQDQANELAKTGKLQTQTLGQQTIADFEDGPTGLAPAMYESESGMNYTIGTHGGTTCGSITSTTTAHENIATEPLDGKFQFTTSNPNVTMDVYNDSNMGTVTYTAVVENTDIPTQTPLTKTITHAITGATWTTLTFPFTTGTNLYNKITFYFEDGRTITPSRTWYFDNITIPSLTYPATLFNRIQIGTNPLGLFLAKGGATWFQDHIAAANILTPDQTANHKWHMFLRGSNAGNSYIGVYIADSSSFDPTKIITGTGSGGWRANPNGNNAILSPDAGHSWETKAVANPVAVVDGSKNIYLYYMSKDASDNKSYNVAVCNAATDPQGLVFTKYASNPLVAASACVSGTHWGTITSVLYNPADLSTPWYHFNHGGSNGAGANNSRIWISKDSSPYVLGDPSTIVVDIGAPGSYDSKSIEAGRIFTVSGDSHKYMIYSTSATKGDYPDRFNIAINNPADITQWTKLNNPTTPYVFLRGHIGQWDQGGNWSCDLLERNGTLYMYYEGWGHQGTMTDRNEAYSGPGGHSQLGISSVSVSAFKAWVAACSPPY